MSQAYSDPTREDDPYSLPDVEVFQHPQDYQLESMPGEDAYALGWYYWYCFPGCLPDSDPIGPYATEAEAQAAHQDI